MTDVVPAFQNYGLHLPVTKRDLMAIISVILVLLQFFIAARTGYPCCKGREHRITADLEYLHNIQNRDACNATFAALLNSLSAFTLIGILVALYLNEHFVTDHIAVDTIINVTIAISLLNVLISFIYDRSRKRWLHQDQNAELVHALRSSTSAVTIAEIITNGGYGEEEDLVAVYSPDYPSDGEDLPIPSPRVRTFSQIILSSRPENPVEEEEATWWDHQGDPIDAHLYDESHSSHIQQLPTRDTYRSRKCKRRCQCARRAYRHLRKGLRYLRNLVVFPLPYVATAILSSYLTGVADAE